MNTKRISGEVECYEDLDVWNLAMQLTEQVYELTAKLPPEERFGMSSQMRRACVSVPSNIAEGSGRGSRKEYARFVSIAKGSLCESRTMLELAKRLELLRIEPAVIETSDRVSMMLTKLRQALLRDESQV